MVTPILLKSFGRSGSTLLMQLLGTNQNVLFERVYPFENRYLTYAYRAALMQSLPVNNDENWNEDKLYSNSFKRLGPIPYGIQNSINKEKLKMELIRHTWSAFSSSFIKEESNLPFYYAEKVDMDICEDLNKALYAKSILLIRDPRDVMVSVKEFNKKRGFLEFSWQDGWSDEDYANFSCKNVKIYLGELLHYQNSDLILKIRYEDLIKEPKRITNQLSEWLGLKLDYNKVLSEKSKFEHHVTSKSAEDSIERWKNELSEEVQAIFKKNIGKELSLLGYEV